MAFDMNSILRRLKVNTAPATGAGMTGLGYGGGGEVGGSGLNPYYSASLFGPSSNDASDPSSPNYKSMDDAAFDSSYQTNWDALQRRLADTTSEYDLANQTDKEEYERAVRETNQQQELDAGSLTDRLANQGLLRSGIHTKAQGDLAGSFQKRLGEYARQNTQAQTQRERSYSGLKRGITDQIAQLQQEKAQRETARQEAIARRLAEQRAAQQDALQNAQPIQTETGTYTPPTDTMGFKTAPRTVIPGIGGEIGIPESPLFIPNKRGLGGGVPWGRF